MISKNGKITLVLRVKPDTARIIVETAAAFEGWSQDKIIKKLKGLKNEK